MHPEHIASPTQHKHTPVSRTFTLKGSFIVSSQPNVHEGKPEKSEMIDRPESRIQPGLFFRVIKGNSQNPDKAVPQ